MPMRPRHAVVYYLRVAHRRRHELAVHRDGGALALPHAAEQEDLFTDRAPG